MDMFLIEYRYLILIIVVVDFLYIMLLGVVLRKGKLGLIIKLIL